MDFEPPFLSSSLSFSLYFASSLALASAFNVAYCFFLFKLLVSKLRLMYNVNMPGREWRMPAAQGCGTSAYVYGRWCPFGGLKTTCAVTTTAGAIALCLGIMPCNRTTHPTPDIYHM